jgi:hypothetical protein
MCALQLPLHLAHDVRKNKKKQELNLAAAFAFCARLQKHPHVLISG